MEDVIFKTAIAAIVSDDYCESDIKTLKEYLNVLTKKEHSLKKEIECNVTLVDISNKAIEVAEENAKENDAEVELLLGSFLEPLKGKYDCIISNPMYLSYGDDVAEIVARSEPVIAHYSGTDGLACYDAILSNAREHLKKKFLIAFQLGTTPIIPLKKKIKKYFPHAEVWIEQDMKKRDMFIFIKEG